MTVSDEHVARVLHICEEALGRGADMRAAYLNVACGTDTTLRREVDALLAGADNTDGFLTNPPWHRPQPALTPGQRLGPYEVIGALGAGGMGAVYKARDSRLDRTVAIKVIAGGAVDPVLRERFTREARAIAALNHPNICAVYDVGRDTPSPGGDDALDFLVIEYLEGDTLARRVAAGPLALDEVLRVGIHVADALAAAHRRGIVHGDVKPANIILSSSPAGPVAKLLDFGLAEPAPAVATRVDTIRPPSTTATRCGPTPRGTLPYMAPEQFHGGDRDTRGDIFAFGCVLYEMVTGRRAFPPAVEASIISAIVNDDPPRPSTVAPLTPRALDDLIARCLSKDPDDRCESASAIADELRRISASNASADPLRLASSFAGRRRWLAATAAVAVSAVGWSASGVPRRVHVEPKALVLPLRDGVDLGSGQSIEFSSDGRAVIYFGIKDGVSAVYWQGLDETDSHVIPGTESAGQPFATPFASPDGKWVGFARAGKLVKLPIRSGRIGDSSAAVVLADGIGWMRGASWGDDGTIVYAPNAYGGLWRVAAGGGSTRELTRPDPARGELSHRWPQVLPGGRAALFTIQDTSGRQDRSIIAVVQLASGEVTRLVEGGSFGRYAPTGHLVYARNGTLMAARFDPASLRISGDPVAVVDGVSMLSAGSGNAKFAISSTGALVYEPALPRPNSRNALVWVNRDGLVEPVTPDIRAYSSALDLSPDGNRLAVRIEDPTRNDSQIWSYDISARRWLQLTFEGDNAAPTFSPAGDRIVFSSNRHGAFNLYVMSANGGAVERLTESPYWQYANSWSRDGRLVTFSQQGVPGANTWILSMADRKVSPWRPEDADMAGATISPDRRWMAYQSEESSRSHVYVRSLLESDPGVRVSGANGGSSPFWSRDGRAVFYVAGATVMAARVQRGVPFRASTPHLAFVLPFAPSNDGNVNVRSNVNALALTPDGQRIVLMRPDPERRPRAGRLLVVPNWSEQLTVKVGSGR